MLKEALQNAPQSAGIYQFFDFSGMLLYVGKAKIIKNRVKSYFRFSEPLSPAPKLSPRIEKMIREVHRVSYIVVQSEHDALILENTLIKQLKPKYNILLRDDKTYPYICVDLREPFARFEITRKVLNHKEIRYFGPFSSSARALLEALYLSFPLVQKKGCSKGKKACLFHQIGRCPAPCEKKIDTKEYAQTLDLAMHALANPSTLLACLKIKMAEASAKLNYEEAATIRDMVQSIHATMHTTHVELLSLGDYDVFAVENNASTAIIMRLFIREGKIVSTAHSIIHHTQGFEKDELYQRALFEFYHPLTHTQVRTILVADTFEEQASMSTFLSEKFGQKMTLTKPQRGEKLPLITLAKNNAQTLLAQHLNQHASSLEENLQRLFDFEALPKRIEVFDNSHLAGANSVGGMIVWEGKFIKSSYRKYRLHHSNEYAQMREMLQRRIEDFSKESPPDLWVLDGGETLLKLARTLLKNAGLHIDLLAIAKEKIDAKANRSKGRANDTLYNHVQSFSLPPSDKRLQFIQKLRDEAHRFALSYHQKKREKNDLQSSLLCVEGLGEAKLKKLLNYFGTFEAIYSASKEELEVTLDKMTVENLVNFLNK